MQRPLQTTYTARTGANEVIEGIDLTGKLAIITGGYAGLGLETTKTLALAGATVIVPARNVEKAKEALLGIPNTVLYPALFDLSERSTIDLFLEWFNKNYRNLDILVNSAGVMAIPLTRDKMGNEMHLSANYLGHYYLTMGLIPKLKKANGARVVHLTSRAHWYSPFHFEDPNFYERPYDKWTAYGHAKTAVSLFSVALDQLFKSDQIRSFAVHPGSIVTGLSSNLSDEELATMGAIKSNGERGFDQYNDENKTISEGAATIVWCATHPQLNGIGGVYCENVNIAPVSTEENDTVGVKPWAIDKDSAIKLWNETTQLFRL